MANHPVNLTVRFILELLVLFALGAWGWTAHTGAARWVLAIGLPLLAAAAWGIFRVDGDPKKAPVRVPGLLRLALELVYFSAGVLAFWAVGRPAWAVTLVVVTLLHYLISNERVAWLLRQ